MGLTGAGAPEAAGAGAVGATGGGTGATGGFTRWVIGTTEGCGSGNAPGIDWVRAE
ncbi:MAG: hypothetical protein IPL51_04140 [Candidatus Competibacteraceae bacterium]|nr:hypothetical protein [Candidatus Competibacteraceae bacterium]